MGIKNVFVKGVETVFKVLKDAVKDGQYIVETDDGWGESSSVSQPVRIILDEFTQDDVDTASFSALIQPTDVKGLVPGKDLVSSISTSGFFVVDERRFTVVAFDTDAMNVMYTVLLRDV